MSKFIRALTGHSISHVALLVWIEGGLWVAEMKEFKGYRLIPASLWVNDNKHNNLYYGKAPEVVRGHSAVLETTLMHRGSRYGYLSLIKVWWAQVTRKNIEFNRLVCSTFVQVCWRATGYKFLQTADPGDYMHLCETNTPIK